MFVILEKLQLSPQVREQTRRNQAQLAAQDGLQVRVDHLSDDRLLWCTAYQTVPALNGEVFTASAIHTRAEQALAPLRGAGYTPVICAYTLHDGPPDRPQIKHRLFDMVQVHGLRSKVLRVAPPRALFAAEGEHLKMVAAESTAELQAWGGLKAEALAFLASRWLKKQVRSRN